MYQIPGYPEPTPEDAARYQREKKALLSKIPDMVWKGLKDESAYVRIAAASMIEYAPEAERTNLIRDGLGDISLSVREASASMIKYAPEAERTNLIRKGLEDEWSVREVAVKMIEYAPEAERMNLIRKGLEDISAYVRKTAASMIEYAPEAERTNLIRDGLGDISLPVHKTAASMIEYAPEAERMNLIRKGLEDKWSVREVAVKMIEYAPEAERMNLIRKGLEDISAYVRKTAASMIEYVPEAEQEALRDIVVRFIRKGLEEEDVGVRKASASMIKYAPEAKRADLIRKGLEDERAYVRKEAASMIKYAPEAEQDALWDIVVRFIRKGLEDEDEFVQEAAEDMIEYVPEAKRGELQEYVSPPLEHVEVSPEELEELEKLAQKTPLYKKAPEKFFRADFEKGGSRTTLLDKVPGDAEKTLKEKVIIRHVRFPAFEAWSDMFEAYDFWKEKGFDYVPIEPILGVRPDRKEAMVVAAFSRVLGPSVAMWKEKTPLFLEQIDTSVRRIIEALEERGVKHGHTHEGNFCLVFNKKDDGTPDLTKPPRVYAIDFDMAASSPPGKGA